MEITEWKLQNRNYRMESQNRNGIEWPSSATVTVGSRVELKLKEVALKDRVGIEVEISY